MIEPFCLSIHLVPASMAPAPVCKSPSAVGSLIIKSGPCQCELYCQDWSVPPRQILRQRSLNSGEEYKYSIKSHDSLNEAHMVFTEAAIALATLGPIIFIVDRCNIILENCRFKVRTGCLWPLPNQRYEP